MKQRLECALVALMVMAFAQDAFACGKATHSPDAGVVLDDARIRLTLGDHKRVLSALEAEFPEVTDCPPSPATWPSINLSPSSAEALRLMALTTVRSNGEFRPARATRAEGRVAALGWARRTLNFLRRFAPTPRGKDLARGHVLEARAALGESVRIDLERLYEEKRIHDSVTMDLLIKARRRDGDTRAAAMLAVEARALRQNAGLTSFDLAPWLVTRALSDALEKSKKGSARDRSQPRRSDDEAR